MSAFKHLELKTFLRKLFDEFKINFETQNELKDGIISILNNYDAYLLENPIFAFYKSVKNIKLSIALKDNQEIEKTLDNTWLKIFSRFEREFG